VTETFRGWTSPDRPVRRFVVDVAAGRLTAVLRSRSTRLVLKLQAVDGSLVAVGKGDPRRLASRVADGSWSLRVASRTRASFTLTVSHRDP
jgi:hypothetical protein